MAISDSTIRQNVFSDVRTILSNGLSTWGASATPVLLGYHPDTNTVVFPTIVLDLVNVNEDNYTIDSSRSVSDKTITVAVFVYTKRNDDAEKISDGVTSAFRSNQITGMYLTSVSEDHSVITPNDNKVKLKTLSFTFRRR
jgi:hypothetical protein